MNKISLISGCPCSGKTTLANTLASSEEKGVHLPLDSFLEFLVHPISPALPESHQQNISILKSGARAAKALFENGYHVFVDGVILPWALLVILEEFKSEVPVEYIVLRASLEDELKRAAKRKEDIRRHAEVPFPEIVKVMHPKFTDLGELEKHVFDTEGLTSEQVFIKCEERSNKGKFDLDLKETIKIELE
jgi:predicted kinase